MDEYDEIIARGLMGWHREAVELRAENERLRAAANAVLWSWDEEHDPSIVDHMEALRALLPPITPPEGFETE